MGVAELTTMATREENRQPNEVALFRSLDPWYGYGTKPDFDAYFANHGYPYGANFGSTNTPSLPYPNYETNDVPFGSYHRGIYSLGYTGSTAYGRHGPHYGTVVGPDDYSKTVGSTIPHYPGHSFGLPAPPPPTAAPYTRGPYGYPHVAYPGYHGVAYGPGYFAHPAAAAA